MRMPETDDDVIRNLVNLQFNNHLTDIEREAVGIAITILKAVKVFHENISNGFRANHYANKKNDAILRREVG